MPQRRTRPPHVRRAAAVLVAVLAVLGAVGFGPAVAAFSVAPAAAVAAVPADPPVEPAPVGPPAPAEQAERPVGHAVHATVAAAKRTPVAGVLPARTAAAVPAWVPVAGFPEPEPRLGRWCGDAGWCGRAPPADA